MQKTNWQRNPRRTRQVQQAAVEGSDEVGTHNWNPEGTLPLAMFNQNENHVEEEVTPSHPSIVGCHNNPPQHAVDIQGEHRNHRLD